MIIVEPGETLYRCDCGEVFSAHESKEIICPRCGEKENKMEWKELEIGNLPPDILVGNYEFEFKNGSNWRWWDRNTEDIFYYMLKDNYKFRYRKPEPKQPTHIDLASQNLSLASGLSKKKATALIKAVIFAYGKESAIGPPEETT